MLFEVTEVMHFGIFQMSAGHRLSSEYVVSYMAACVNDNHEQKRVFENKSRNHT